MKQILTLLLLLASIFLLTGCGHHHRHHHRFFTSSVSNVTTLTIGIPVTGHINDVEDADKYTVVLEKDKVYLFHTFNLSADMDTVLLLFNSEGVLLAENDNGSEVSLASVLQYQIPEDGVYCIVVRHKSPEANSGMYDLIVEFVSDAPAGDDTGDGDGGDDSGDGDSDDGDGSDDGSGDEDDGSDDDDGDESDDDDDDDSDDSDCDRHRHQHTHTHGQGHKCDDD